MAMLSACEDTLDTHPAASFTEETVWSSASTIQAFTNNVYNSVITSCLQSTRSTNSFGNDGCNWENKTPNAVFCGNDGSRIDYVANESGSFGNGTDFGTNRAGLLRQCNLILENVETCEALTASEKELFLATGHFLRGIVFFDQARKFGRFLPIDKVLAPGDEEVAKSYKITSGPKESWPIVIADLEAAVKGLPTTAAAGYATKYAAEVILSRACLQAYAYTKDATYLTKAEAAAKDVIVNCGGNLSSNYGGLFNEDGANDPEILWGYYCLSTSGPHTAFSDWSEIQLTVPNIGNDQCNNTLSPNKFKNPNGVTFENWPLFWPTQEGTDNYLVTDEATGEALPWYETSQYKENVEEIDPASITEHGQIDIYECADGHLNGMPTAQDLVDTKPGFPTFQRVGKLKAGATRTISDIMYSGRDARFAQSIIYDQCPDWQGEICDLMLSGNLSTGVRGAEDGPYATSTGYYYRKYVPEHVVEKGYRFIYGTKYDMHFCLARVGEAYLNLAEAQLLQGKVADAVASLNATRTTHGKIAPSRAATEAEAWKDYIRERNAEMLIECGDTYFSWLRWGMLGSKTGVTEDGKDGGVIAALNAPIHKMEINRERNTFLIAQNTFRNAAMRQFHTHRYYLPLAQSWLDTREAYGLDHEQNAGY